MKSTMQNVEPLIEFVTEDRHFITCRLVDVICLDSLGSARTVRLRGGLVYPVDMKGWIIITSAMEKGWKPEEAPDA